ncbi:MAG TPA: cupin domain-containing protein [Candidatus Scatomonas pullistercoris]|uniref:Cupin domain-containing protein n=1 Tax=Candidatus Scatomonas pullistercoris TaxID=2840920 RepID=A0A9D1P2C6_9FIRM|nr:cupin domain-containing protein [Candidatus Scatomonas pullistercoris]
MHRPPRTAAPAAPEKIHYNFSDYPVYIRRDHLSQYPNYSGTAHWHEDPEFILILSGHMVYNVNGRRIHLTEGSGILVNSCQFHHGFSADGSDCEFICIIVSPLLLSANEYFERTYIAPILKNEDFPWLLLSPETDWQQGMLDCLRDIFRESREKNHFLEIQQQLLRLWGLLYRHTAPAEPGTASGLAAPVIIPNCFGNISTVPPGITGEAAEPKNPLSAYKQHKFLLSIFISRDYNKIRIYFEGSVRI